MRAIAIWSGAIAGLLLIVVGGLIQAAVPWPSSTGLGLTSLPITLQVPALLLTALPLDVASMVPGAALWTKGLLIKES